MNAHEVLVHTRDRLPAPFAQLAGELLFELDAAQPDHVRAFLIQIDLFEATVAFFSFLQLAELEARQLASTHSESAITALRDNPRITTGYWWSLLRESSRDLGTQPDGPRHGASRLMQQLLFDETGQSTAFSRVLDSVPGIRNRIKGHAWTLPLERYATESDRLLELTVRYLHALEGLADFCMFEIVSSTPAGGGFDCDSLVFVGDTRRRQRQQRGFLVDRLEQRDVFTSGVASNLHERREIEYPRTVKLTARHLSTRSYADVPDFDGALGRKSRATRPPRVTDEDQRVAIEATARWCR